MLQIINSGSSEITLNNWDKTSPIIKELEQTVNFAERKYGDLMQQLNYYKRYYEKWSQNEKINNGVLKNEIHIQRKTKKKYSNNIPSNSSSDNENVNPEPQKVNQYFYEKLKSKISKINNEITEANKKLALKESNSEMSADKEVFDNVSKAQEVAKDAANLKQAIKFDSVVTAEKKSPKMERKSSAKSIPIKNTNFKKRHWPTLRRRHSSLQPYKLRSKSLPAGVRRKFGFGSFVDVVERQPTSVIKLCRSKSTVKSGSKKCSNTRLKHQKVEHIKRPSFKTKKSSTPVKSVRSKTSVKNDKKILPTKLNKSNMAISSEKEIPQRKAISQNNIPYANLSESLCLNKVTPSCSSFRDVIEDVKQDINVSNKESKNFNRKPNPLVALAKQPIPFTICASTSKSFNLGLNIQQVLSMVKHKRRTITLQEILKDNLKTTCSVLEKEPEVNTLFISKARSQIGSEICPAREENDDCLSCITDHIETRSRCTILSKAQSARCQDLETKNLIDPNSVPKLTEEVEKFERPEDVWVIEQPDSRSDLRKTRSRCTCFPTKQCVDYNKVLRQYTGWRLPIAKSEVFNQDLCHAGYRPRLTFTNYNGNQLYPIPSQENVHRTIETNHDGMKAEMMKTHNDLMKLHRKYAMLQEQIAQNNIDDLEAQAELDALESEISSRELEYKDIMNSYNQLMALKERLKFLRKNGGSLSLSVIQQQQFGRSRKNPFRPTPSMALTKVLRQIQCLQDKIKLTDAP